MLAVVLSIQYWQAQRFKDVHSSILELTAADVSYLAVYHGQFATGTPIKITDQKEIGAFLEGFQVSERYSPNHETPTQHLAVRIAPQEIHLILSLSEKHENTVSGGIGEFGSGRSYKHYGWFLSEGLYVWHQRQYENVRAFSLGGS